MHTAPSRGMSRTATRNFLKTANVAAIDAFTRARFLEGMSLTPEGRVVRNQPAPVLTGQVIPALVGGVLQLARERAGADGDPSTVAASWTAAGNTRLYEHLLETLTRMFYDEEIALTAMARALSNEGGVGSVWEAGKLTANKNNLLRRFAEGDYAPTEAFKIILSLARRDALDVARVLARRDELTKEHQEDIKEEAGLSGFSEDEWESVIGRLADSNSQAAREFWQWAVGQAERKAHPAVVAYFERLAQGITPRGDQIAAEFGVSTATVSVGKNQFVAYLAGLLAGEDLSAFPAVLHLLSDSKFYSDLMSGRVHGDRVAAPDRTAGAGQGLGFRVAHSLAELAAKGGTGAVGAPEWPQLCGDLADAFRKAAPLSVEHQAEFAEAFRAWWKLGAYGR